MDAWRSGSAYQVALDLPGVDPERIELICERNGLTIRAERAADYGEQDEVLIAGRLQPAHDRSVLGRTEVGHNSSRRWADRAAS